MDMSLVQFLKYGALNIIWLLYALLVGMLGRVAFRRIENYFKLDLSKVPSLNNIFFKGLLYVGVGFFILGVLSIPFYIFNWSSFIYTILVWLLLVGAMTHEIVIFIKYYKEQNKKTIISFSISKKNLILYITIIAFLIFLVSDFIFSVWHGANFSDGSDMYVHFARIFDISNDTFSIKDGFLRGVDEVRYAINFLYAFFIPLTKPLELMGVNQIPIGFSAHFIFRVLQMLAAGAFTFFVVKENVTVNQRGVYVLSFFAILATFFINHFSWANYPNVVVFAWYVILFVGGVLIYKKNTKTLGLLLLLLSAILIAGTHPTYALMASIYVVASRVLIMIIQLFMGGVNRKKTIKETSINITLIIATAILMAPSVFAYMTPNNMSGMAMETEGGAMSSSVLGVEIINPVSGIIGWSNNVGIVGSILFVMSALGLCFLFYLLYKKPSITSVQYIGMILFVLFTTANPLFMLVAEKAGIPWWLLLRFSSANIFITYQVFLVFGLYLIYLAPRFFDRNMVLRLATKSLSCILILVCITSLVSQARLTYATATQHGLDNSTAASGVFNVMRDELLPFLPSDKEVLILSTSYISYYLPLIAPKASVLSIDALHMPPAAAGDYRESCQQNLLLDVGNGESLRSLGVDYVILDEWQQDDMFNSQLETLRNDKINFTEIHIGDIFVIFKVNDGASRQSIVECSKFLEIERQ